LVESFLVKVTTPGCCGGQSLAEHLASCEAGSTSLTPLDDAWRCDKGRELFGVNCANNCGLSFGNDREGNSYSARSKGNTIFVCLNVSRGVCSFALCKKCYVEKIDGVSTRRGRRSRK